MSRTRELFAAPVVEGHKSRNFALELRACEIDARLDFALKGGIYLWYAAISRTADRVARRQRDADEPQRREAPAEAA